MEHHRYEDGSVWVPTEITDTVKVEGEYDPSMFEDEFKKVKEWTGKYSVAVGRGTQKNIQDLTCDVIVFPVVNYKIHPQYQTKTYFVHKYGISRSIQCTSDSDDPFISCYEAAVSAFSVELETTGTLVLLMNGNIILRRKVSNGDVVRTVPLNLYHVFYNQMTAEIWCETASTPKLKVNYQYRKARLMNQDTLRYKVHFDDRMTLYIGLGMCFPYRIPLKLEPEWCTVPPPYDSKSLVIDQKDIDLPAEAILSKYLS